MRNTIFLSIVVPAYNEESRIERTINSVSNYFNKKGYQYEIIVVNDASCDATKDIVEEKVRKLKHVKLINLKKNQWKGGAVRAGMLAAKGKFILMSDADLATPLKEFEKLFDKVEAGCEVAVASRGLKQSRILRGSSFWREFMSKLFGQLTKLLVMSGIEDPQCGFKLFTRKAARTIFRNKISPTPCWDIDVLVYATKQGYKISEVPVTWKHDPDSRLTYNLDRSLKVFLELLRIKIKHRIFFPVVIDTR